eukprot:54338-Eustigmatos_ZCMA.PRE.1
MSFSAADDRRRIIPSPPPNARVCHDGSMLRHVEPGSIDERPLLWSLDEDEDFTTGVMQVREAHCCFGCAGYHAKSAAFSAVASVVSRSRTCQKLCLRSSYTTPDIHPPLGHSDD